MTATAVDAAARARRRRPRTTTHQPLRPGADAPPPRPADRDPRPLRPSLRARRLRRRGPGDPRRRRRRGQETVLAVVGAALRDSIRLVDETFRLEEDALCVLAPEPGHGRRGADGRAAARVLDELEAAGGLRVDDLGRRRRLPRARRRRPSGCCARPTRRCGGPAPWASRWASASCKIADRFAKSVHNWRKPGIRVGECARARITVAHPTTFCRCQE